MLLIIRDFDDRNKHHFFVSKACCARRYLSKPKKVSIATRQSRVFDALLAHLRSLVLFDEQLALVSSF
jgi:hypothetical protein